MTLLNVDCKIVLKAIATTIKKIQIRQVLCRADTSIKKHKAYKWFYGTNENQEYP